MRILVNYDKEHENYTPTIAGLLKQKGLTALATGKNLSMMDLLSTAEQAKCQAILLCNAATLNNCVDNQSKKQVTLDKYRGSRLNFSTPVIVGAPLNHLRIVRHGRWLYEKDLDKFKHIHTPVTQLQFSVCKDRQQLDAAYEKSREALIISCDIEINRENKITCVSFALLNKNLTTTTFVIPFINFGVDFWDKDDDYAYAIQTMQRISKLPAAKLFFNGMYDSTHLIRYNSEPHNFTLDSMALAHAEFSELPKTLDFVASYQLYDYYYWKDDADDAAKQNDIYKYWAYCARDSWNTLRCFLMQIRTAKSYAFRNYKELFKLVYPYLYTGYEGFLVDNNIRQRNRQKTEENLEALGKDLCKMAADPNFKPNSPKQVAELLFDILGAQPVGKAKVKVKKNKDGTTTKEISRRGTDEKTLMKIGEQHPLLQIFIDKILEYRGERKAISTYFDFIQWENRMLYSINPFGTDTGRASSNSSSFWGYNSLTDSFDNCGTQVQNTPMYAKEHLIADEGFEVGEADNNKSEARCVAFLSKCLKLKEALADKEKDFYKNLGVLFFGLEYNQVSTDLRNKVLKRIVHGRNYLMGANTFIDHVGSKQLYEGAKLLNYPIKTLKAFAEYLLSLYNEPFPELEDWYKELRLEVVRNSMITSPLGYTRYIFGDPMKDHNVFRALVAHAPQNLSVMIINKGVWRIYKKLVLPYNGDFRLKGQIHDSVLFQWKKERRDEFMPILLDCLDNPVKIHGDTLRIPVDVNVGHSWYDLKT